jgi:hypothetical protein
LFWTFSFSSSKCPEAVQSDFNEKGIEIEIKEKEKEKEEEKNKLIVIFTKLNLLFPVLNRILF